MVENNDTPLAQNIRSRMELTGKSIKDISDCLGVTYEMARRYTLATARPRQGKLAKLAELLGTTLQELEYGTTQARKVTITKATQPPQAPSAAPKRSLSFKNPEEMARYMVNENPTALAELLRHLANQIDKK